jgi:hypothetical protein
MTNPPVRVPETSVDARNAENDANADAGADADAYADADPDADDDDDDAEDDADASHARTAQGIGGVLFL